MSTSLPRCQKCRGKSVIRHGATRRGTPRLRCQRDGCQVTFVATPRRNKYPVPIDYWKAYRKGYRVYS